MFNFFLLCQGEINLLQCSPHPLSYPFESLFICVFESVLSLNFISNDFKVRGNFKKRIVHLFGDFHHLGASLEKANCKSACQNSSVLLSVSACWKHNSFSGQQYRDLEPKSNASTFLSNLYRVVCLEPRSKIFYSSFVTKRCLIVLWCLSIQAIGEAQRTVKYDLTRESWSISLSSWRCTTF